MGCFLGTEPREGTQVLAADRMTAGSMDAGDMPRLGGANCPSPGSEASPPPLEGRRAGEEATRCFIDRDF